QDGVAEAAVEDVGARDAAFDGGQAGLHLRDHAGRQRGQQLGQVDRVELADHLVRGGPVQVEALDVGQHDELGRAERHRQGGGGGVGVDVVDRAVAVAAGDAGDDREAAVVEQRLHHRRVGRDDLADQADVDRLAVDQGVLAGGGEQVGVLAGEADRVRAVPVDEADDVLVDLAVEHHPDHVDGLLGGDPQPGGEDRLDPEPVEVGGHLRAAAVHDHRAEPGAPQEHQVLGEPGPQLVGRHRVPAVLDHHGLAVELIQPRQRLDQRGRLGGGGGPAGGVLAAGDHDRHVEYAEFSCT